MPNHLIDETSPYLLQHAHNPVDWFPWGPEALEKAKRMCRSQVFLNRRSGDFDMYLEKFATNAFSTPD